MALIGGTNLENQNAIILLSACMFVSLPYGNDFKKTRYITVAVHMAVTDLPSRFCCVGSCSSTVVEGALVVFAIFEETPFSAALASTPQRNITPSIVTVSVPPVSTPDAVRVTPVSFTRLSKMIDGKDARTVAPLAPRIHSSI